MSPEPEPVGTAEEAAADLARKRQRVIEFLDREGLDALVVGRQDNFAWLTGGGDNRVVTTSEMGAALAVVTKTHKWLVAYPMDSGRILDEEIAGQGFEPIVIRWYEGSLGEKALELTRGMRTGADFALPEAHQYGSEITDLHYPLTDLELKRCRWLGGASNRILAAVAAELKPGMTERAVAARLLHEYALAGMTLDVLLVGFDHRIVQYRHSPPTDNTLESYALLHPAARRWGLHANVTRLVHFGAPPADIRQAIDAAISIAAGVFAMIEPGRRFAEILDEQKMLYREFGFPEEWHNHFQGGVTGYTLADPTCCLNPEARIVDGQAFDYFITITGAKFEELTLLAGGRTEMPSAGPGWPLRKVETQRGVVMAPDVWIR